MSEAIRPFEIDVPDAVLADLRERKFFRTVR